VQTNGSLHPASTPRGIVISPNQVMLGSYDYRLVALSVVIAGLAAYAALDLAGRVTSARGAARRHWLAGGAAAMGIGIWSMHYVGMLAFHLPVPVEYDWPTILLSLLAAIFASGVALFAASRRKMGPPVVIIGSIFMGGGIAGMHYIGMAAMRIVSAVCASAGNRSAPSAAPPARSAVARPRVITTSQRSARRACRSPANASRPGRPV